MVKKICFWGGPFGVVPGGVVPPNYVKIFVSQISSDIQKNWHPSLSRSKNCFLGPHFGGVPGGVAPKKFQKTQLRMYLNNFTQKLDFYVLWFRRTRAYKI